METEVRLAGREDELAALDAALAEARRGAGAALALVGEAGIGKSALLAALRERAGGMLVLDGRASEHERDVPFGVLVDALDDAVSTVHPRRLEALGEDRLAELAAVLPAVARHLEGSAGTVGREPADRFHMHRALRGLLELLGGAQPVLVVLDDLHWADPASVELACHLLRRPPRAPHALALGFRPLAAALPLADALRSAPQARRLDLRPLDRPAALEVLAGVADAKLRDRLEQEARGNPLFLHELARVAGEGPIPPTIIAAVQREAAALPPASRTLLDGAAVAGDPFDPELAAAAAGIATEDAPGLLDHLVSADLVRPGAGLRTFAFRHPLVRQAVHEAAPPGWRLGAHERAAAALAARGAPPAARAHHVAQCARPGDRAAIATLIEAGDAGLRTAPAASAHWYEAARRLAPADDLDTIATLEYHRMRALSAAGRLVEAIEVGRAALDRGLIPPAVPHSQYLEEVGGLELTIGRVERVRRRGFALLAALPDDAPALERARLELGGAMLNLSIGEEMRPHAERALAALGDAPTPMRANAHATLAICALMEGRPEESDGHLASAEAIVATIDEADIARRMGSIHVLGMAYTAKGRLRDADAVFARAGQIARATSQAHWLAILGSFRALVLLQLGRVEEARGIAEAGEDLARLGGQTGQLVVALADQALCLDLADRAVESRRLAAEAVEIGRDLDRHIGVRGAMAIAAALDAEADPERCRAVLLADAALDAHDPSWALWLQGALVRAELTLGLRDIARERATAMTAGAEQRRLGVGLARARCAAAEVALADGDPGGASALASAAVAGAEAAGAVLDAIRARTLAGAALGAAGDAQAAGESLRRAATDAEHAGAHRLRSAASRELRRLGQRAPAVARPGAIAGLAGLSPREREIVALVTAGRSNKQVGAALHLSDKTIENALSRIYAKVGVRSRGELAALARASASAPAG